jgi:hypothetical protein
MMAHKEMTDPDITYEDMKRAADQNGRSVDQVLAMIAKTVEKDRGDHAAEYTDTKTA